MKDALAILSLGLLAVSFMAGCASRSGGSSYPSAFTRQAECERDGGWWARGQELLRAPDAEWAGDASGEVGARAEAGRAQRVARCGSGVADGRSERCGLRSFPGSIECGP